MTNKNAESTAATRSDNDYKVWFTRLKERFLHIQNTINAKPSAGCGRFRGTLAPLTILAAAVLAASCTDKDKAEARQTLNAAQTEYAKGNYPRTLALIDSLRHNHPKAIEERREALKLFQDASEKMAQADIEKTDRAIQSLAAEIQKLQAAADNGRADGSATAAQLNALTAKRLKLDSLRARFEAQCATVKVIRQRRNAKN